MPLLAPQHKLVLRHLLSRDGTALPSELSVATGLEAEDVLNALDHLHRTDLAVPMPHTPGLGEGRWSLTSHGRQVGPSLAKGEPNSRTDDDGGDPAEGWGFPWRPVKKEAPFMQGRCLVQLVKTAKQFAGQSSLSKSHHSRHRVAAGVY